jgi:hypothetical protein
LAAATAQTGGTNAAAAAGQFEDKVQGDAGTGGPGRMSDGYCAAVDIHVG